MIPRPHSLSAPWIASILVGYGVCVGSLCAQTGTPTEQNNNIRGTVINSATGKPLGRALVYSPDNRFAKLTDAEGRFEFVLPSAQAENNSATVRQGGSLGATSVNQTPRPYALMARKPGFLPLETAQEVPLSSTQNELIIRLVPEALILGRVNVAAADGSDKLQVELYRRQIQNGRARWFPVNTVTTKSDGEFRFAELPAGIYKLFTHEQLDRDPLTFDPRGQMYGYPPVYYPSANNFASASAIELSAGATVQVSLAPSRRPYYPVEIGIANMLTTVPMQVSVQAAGQKGPGYSLGYNQEEQKIVGLLPDGAYTVEVSTFGPTQASGIANISVNGGPAKGQSIALVPNATIGVNVSEEFSSTENNGAVTTFVYSGPPGSDGVSNQPPRHPRYVQVNLEPDEDLGSGRGASLRQPSGPDDESLVVENVQPGRYWVHVDALRGYVASANCGGTDLLRRPLVVAPGGSTPPIEVTLRDDAAQLDVTIEDAAAVSGAAPSALAKQFHVYLVPQPESAGQFREISAGSGGGEFSFGLIAPGDYRVLTFDRPRPDLEFTNEEVMHQYAGKAQLVRLLPSQKQHLRLHLISQSD